MILNLLQSTLIPAAANDSIPSVKEDLKQIPAMSLDDLLNRFTSTLVDFAIHLAIAIVVFYVGKLIINKLYSLVSSIMIKRKVDRSLTTFVLT